MQNADLQLVRMEFNYGYSLFIFLGFLTIGVSLYIIYNGKPTQILLDIAGFLDSFELTDFDTVGRIKYDYKPWLKDKSNLLVTGKILFNNYFLNWGSNYPIPIEFKIVDEDIPIGMEIELKQKENIEAFVPGYTMTLHHKCRKNSTFQFYLVLKQIDNNLVFKNPRFVKFGIEANFKVTRWFFFSASQKTRVHYQFYIGPDLGETWVAFDPGTSGSCIASGNSFTNVIIEKEKEAEKVMPSVLTFNKTLEPTTIFDKKNKINKNLYQFGDKALAQVNLDRNLAFQSIKKLLGFADKKLIEYSNGKKLELNGSFLSSLLVEGLFDEFKEFVEKKPTKYKDILTNKKFIPKRAVVAVPNNFTAFKVTDMLSCIQYVDSFKEIRYITEAESVLCYYIYQHSHLHPNAEDELKDETVLIFDMGGATINTTIADVTKMEKGINSFYDIDIDSKIGYGIGGDTIDYCLAKTIFEYEDDYPSLAENNPFSHPLADSIKKKDSYKRLCRDIQRAMLELKKQMIERFYEKPLVKKNEKKGYNPSQNDYEKLFNRNEYRILVTNQELSDKLNLISGVNVNIKETSKLYQLFKENQYGHFPIFESKYFQKYVYNSIREAVSDVIGLSYKDGGYIDTVIFSGRSCLFPLIKETVKSILRGVKNASNPDQKIKPVFISLNNNELKTAVVKGACWYGIHNNSVNLSPLRVNSTYGVKRKKSANPKDISFHKLIPIGKEFNKDSEGAFLNGVESISDDFIPDVQFVHFYQVMGQDALQILKNDEKHKFSKISSLKIDSRTQKIGVEVYSSDKVDCIVWKENGETIQDQKKVNDQEIGDANEEHYTWITN